MDTFVQRIGEDMGGFINLVSSEDNGNTSTYSLGGLADLEEETVYLKVTTAQKGTIGEDTFILHASVGRDLAGGIMGDQSPLLLRLALEMNKELHKCHRLYIGLDDSTGSLVLQSLPTRIHHHDKDYIEFRRMIKEFVGIFGQVRQELMMLMMIHQNRRD